jgi:hypothetical protein
LAQDRGRIDNNDRHLREKFNDIEQRRALREIERNTRERDRVIDTDRCVRDGRGVCYLVSPIAIGGDSAN